jgi:transcriptional regulator with PAS, ATPase and Fis domain
MASLDDGAMPSGSEAGGARLAVGMAGAGGREELGEPVTDRDVVVRTDASRLVVHERPDEPLRRPSAEDRLRAAEDLNRAILASIPVALLVLDRQGRVTHVSDAWTALNRCAECPEAVRSGADYLSAVERCPEERLASAPGFRDAVQAVLDGRRGDYETLYHCSRSGRERDLRITVTRQGVRGGALIVQTDVAELEQARADLERSRVEVREFRERLDAETACLRKEVFRVGGFDEIVGTSAVLSKVLHGIEQVAAADSPILILGETGTGKDLAARAIHERSRRRNRPLVPVNCAALPDALIESELFGYERGAFTGAVARTLGRFEAANGGSILLDEIGEMPLGAQAKLLRVLEAGTFERLGSSRTVQVDVRVIAATNRDLEKEVREGRFRADLYYRLNVFPVTLPPLRERVEDVPLLVWHFINAKQGALGRSIKRVPERLMRAFEGYAWPGNVRELENVIERALIVSAGPTLEVDAPFLEARAQTRGTSLDDVQRAHIEEVLRQCGWKVAGKGNAAERLGLKRGTLQFRMKKLGIQRPESGA